MHAVFRSSVSTCKSINTSLLLQHVEGITAQRNTYRIQSIDGSVVSYETLCREGDKHFAVISIVAGEAFDDGELDQTSLHWACTPKQGGAWEGPPPGWKTEPDSSLDAGKLSANHI